LSYFGVCFRASKHNSSWAQQSKGIAPHEGAAASHSAQCATPFDKLRTGLLTPYDVR
jgi:hypothetical protein